MPKFSIITPTWDRVEGGKLERCLNSIMIQTFRDFEYIVVDDGSIDETEDLVRSFEGKIPGLRYIKVPHRGRVIARNVGTKHAIGENISWLDSDDALDAEYLNTFAYNIDKNPEAKLWVCGAIVHGVLIEDGVHKIPKWTKIRAAQIPPIDDAGNHSIHFDSGTLGTGMFMYHRDCLDKIGYMPDWNNHYEIADGANDWLGYTTPYSAAKKWIGNPHGSDWVQYRKLTMFYRVHLIEAALYVQYVR